jgi:hypothetical protein
MRGRDAAAIAPNPVCVAYHIEVHGDNRGGRVTCVDATQQQLLQDL